MLHIFASYLSPKSNILRMIYDIKMHTVCLSLYTYNNVSEKKKSHCFRSGKWTVRFFPPSNFQRITVRFVVYCSFIFFKQKYKNSLLLLLIFFFRFRRILRERCAKVCFPRHVINVFVKRKNI